MVLRVPFYDAYKSWRNQARKFSRDSMIRSALARLQAPTTDQLDALRRAPWQLLLLIKWVCQDTDLDKGKRPDISLAELDRLRQLLWTFPERVNFSPSQTLTLQLYARRLLRPQIAFQQPLSRGFIREAALLLQLPPQDSLRQLFTFRTNLEVPAYIDLAMATYTAVLTEHKSIGLNWFRPLGTRYSANAISSFVELISRSVPELVRYCQSLPDAKRKVASELFEFPVLARYPFLRTNHTIECWHPFVFYRGMESMTHSILSEAGQEYIDPFSKLFERHVLDNVSRHGALAFYTEADLRRFTHPDVRLPDGLLSYLDANVFIESKAGLFDESVMTVAHDEMFSHKTRALRHAVSQAWSASDALRDFGRAPEPVRNATADYLLIVTNRDLYACRGQLLEKMYPAGTFEPPSQTSVLRLPLERIYVISIEDYERLMTHLGQSDMTLPEFLADCVQIDSDPTTEVFLFDQHLNRRRVPLAFSPLVESAIDESMKRLEAAFAPT